MEKWIEDNGQWISGVIGFSVGVAMFAVPVALMWSVCKLLF